MRTKATNPEPRLVQVNDAIAEITGWRAEELLADPSLFDRIIADEGQARLRAATAEGHGTPIDIRIRHRDGATRWVSVAMTVIPGADGTPWLVQGIARDVDSRRRAEAALRIALEEESAAAPSGRLQQMTSTFLTAVSHELRTPLTLIGATTKTLQSHHRQLGDDQIEALLGQRCCDRSCTARVQPPPHHPAPASA